MSASDKAILIVDDEEGIRIGPRQVLPPRGLRGRGGGHRRGGDRPGREVLLRRRHPRRAAGRRRTRGCELLSELRSRDPDLSVVMVTGYGSVESAVRAMKDGASDYILKPIDNARLLEAVRRSIELARLRRDNAYLRRELIANVYSHDIVTRDARYLSLIELADRVKDSEATVLLSGESGTGKEVMARYIHFTGQPARQALRGHQLRRPLGDPPPIRALRAREGFLHRGRRAAHRQVRARASRHPLPRRDRRHVAAGAVQVPPRPRGIELRAGGRRRSGSTSTYASSRRRTRTCPS